MSEPKSLLADDSGRCGDWFLSFKGNRIWPFDMRPGDIDIEEIAHALGNICRFGGHVPAGFYSVAQHSVHVAEALADEPLSIRQVGLLHDATEAYCGDMIRPIKRSLPEYRAMEDGIWAAIAGRFDLELSIPQAVKEADARMLQTERRDLLAPHPWKWTNAQANPDYPLPYDFKVEPWSPREAADLFLAAFEEMDLEDGERLLRSRENCDRRGR